jgi:hypothetical protein
MPYYAVLRRAYDKGGILLQYYSVRICGRNLYCSGNKASNYCSNYGVHTTGYTVNILGWWKAIRSSPTLSPTLLWQVIY